MLKDAKVFFDLMNKNREHLARFMPRILETRSLEDVERVIVRFLKQLSENNGFRAGIYVDNQLIGIAGLKYIDWYNSKTEVMYWIDEVFKNRGITTVCVKKIIEVAFKHYGLNKVIIKMSVDNLSSIKVAEKCGLNFEGINRQDEVIGSGFSDIRVYSILKDEYETHAYDFTKFS
jgi:ribosomal-protein-serine acetyltransferase